MPHTGLMETSDPCPARFLQHSSSLAGALLPPGEAVIETRIGLAFLKFRHHRAVGAPVISAEMDTLASYSHFAVSPQQWYSARAA